MLFDSGIEDLIDDGFEGSKLERSIFREIFFRNDVGHASKKCLVTGAINFECESSKNADPSTYSNSDNSAITSHFSSEPETFPKISATVKENGKELGGKVINSSIYDPDIVESDPVKISSASLEKSASTTVSEVVTFRLVECSKQGLKSSCYLLKQHGEIVRGITFDEAKERTEAVFGKTIASPVSQESFASRLFFAENQTLKSHPLPDLKGSQEPETFEHDTFEIGSKENLKKDPRPILQYHVARLLGELGWEVEKRQRPNRTHLESVYRMPNGKLIRVLAKAWRVCGEILRADKNDEDTKQWCNITQFLSDLVDTLVILDKEENRTELAYRWRLLDPFVVVAFIDRKIGALRKGQMVKASHGLVKKNGVDHQISKEGDFLDFSQQAANCLCSVSGHQDGNVKCPICNKSRSNIYVDTTNEVSSLENNDEFMGLGVTDFEHRLLESGYECPNSTTQGSVPFQKSESSQLEQADSFSPGDGSKKKNRKKSKKLSEMELISISTSASPDGAFLLSDNGDAKFVQSNQDQENPPANANMRGIPQNPLSVNSSFNKIQKKVSKSKRNSSTNSEIKKKSVRCHIEDDDLLVSAIIKNKNFSPSSAIGCNSWKKACKSKAWRKRKSKKRTCHLLPSTVNGGKHLKDGKWYSVGVRTVLSWLINTEVISLNDVVQYRNPNDNAVLKDGLISRDGILCKCCGKLFSISGFKAHAGFKSNRPCLNLFMESGKPFTICQLQAWSDEYKIRKGGSPAVQVDNDDRNDDSCGHCGEGGELLCCDNCPSTFHQSCLPPQDLPEGSWYCPNCACWICGSFVNDKDVSSASYGLKCSQCEHKYHEACLNDTGRHQAAVSDSWFCSRSCQEVNSGLQSRTGVTNHAANEFSWALLKCIHDDQKVHSAQRFALKAESNSRLSVALTIMEECFLSMIDARTGINMIPHVIYNWGSNFARLNFQGFYTVVLEKDDVLISVACIRVHGTEVAEMPLVATCSKYRRQGMCRILVTQIEEMLRSVKVEKIVVAAIPDLVETWTKGFGFKLVEETDKLAFSKFNFMVFPGTVRLEKHLNPDGHNAYEQPGNVSEPLSLTTKLQSESKERFSESHSIVTNDIDTRKQPTEPELEGQHETKLISGESGVDSIMSSVGVEGTTEECNALQDRFSKMSCEDLAQEEEINREAMDARDETPCSVSEEVPESNRHY